MKFGVRTPSIKKSIKARTTGKVKRMAKSTINPTYGKKGMGYINNPKKAVYNNIYNKTTIDALDSVKKQSNSKETIDYEINENEDKKTRILVALIVFIITLTPAIISILIVFLIYKLGS